MKQVGVLTATRAEYGVLKNIIKQIEIDEKLQLQLIVTGTHLVKEYGYTVTEIETDGFPIAEKINILMNADSPDGISKTMGMASILFSDLYQRRKLDMLIVVGDRYELLPICASAINAGIPIAHISGGEITEGAIDDCIRHCITKMSYLHFPGCEQYRKRIIQLGESPERVFNFGDIGVESLYLCDYISKEKLCQELQIPLHMPFMSVTYHPVTLDYSSPEKQILALLNAIDIFPQIFFIFSKANSDAGNRNINFQIDKFVAKHNNCVAFESLGSRRYLSLLKYSSGIIGNSSSGIIEAPSFHIPTINIGDRQKGRLQASSIINCKPDMWEIVHAIKYSQTDTFQALCKTAVNPYENGNTSEQIVNTIKDFLYNNKILIKKRFFDVNFEVQ